MIVIVNANINVKNFKAKTIGINVQKTVRRRSEEKCPR